MFEPADQVLDLARSELSPGNIDGQGSAEGQFRRGEPLNGTIAVALKELQSPAEQPSRAQKPVGFFGQQMSIPAAPRHGSGSNLQPVEQPFNAQPNVSLEVIERIKGESTLNTAY